MRSCPSRAPVATGLVVVLTAALCGCLGCGKRPPSDVHGTGSNVPIDPRLAAELQRLEAVEINSQGATFVEPIMKLWTNEFADKTAGKVKINYQGTGSGAGITRALAPRRRSPSARPGAFQRRASPRPGRDRSFR